MLKNANKNRKLKCNSRNWAAKKIVEFYYARIVFLKINGYLSGGAGIAKKYINNNENISLYQQCARYHFQDKFY
jgi:hypothetical protein